jgi:hypothetical protein
MVCFSMCKHDTIVDPNKQQHQYTLLIFKEQAKLD